MKKAILTVFVLTAVFLLAEDDVVIKDVSPQIPEYGIIRFLVKNGIMDLMENGKFGGDVVVSRYDLARYLYNLIKYIRSVSPEAISTGGIRLIDEIYYLLGYDPEKKDFQRLVVVEEKLKGLEERVLKIEEEASKLRGDLDEKGEEIEKLKGEMGDLMENLKMTDERISRVSSALEEEFKSEASRLSLEIEKMKSVYGELEGNLEKMEESLKALWKKVGDIEERIKGSEKKAAERVDESGVKDVLDRIKRLEDKILEMEDEIDMINSRVSNLEVGPREVVVPSSPSEAPPASSVIDFEEIVRSLEEEMGSLLEASITELRRELEERIGKLEGAKPVLEKEDLGRIKEEIEKSVKSSLVKKEFVERNEFEMKLEGLKADFTKWMALITVIIGLMITAMIFLRGEG